MDIEQLFDSMTTDERNEFLNLLIAQHKEDANLRQLNAIAIGVNGAIQAVLTKNDYTFVDAVRDRRQQR